MRNHYRCRRRCTDTGTEIIAASINFPNRRAPDRYRLFEPRARREFAPVPAIKDNRLISARTARVLNIFRVVRVAINCVNCARPTTRHNYSNSSNLRTLIRVFCMSFLHQRMIDGLGHFGMAVVPADLDRQLFPLGLQVRSGY